MSVRRATEDDLRAVPSDGRKYELVDGQIVVSPAGFPHGKISLRLGARLLAFVDAQDLGHVLDSSTGFRLPGGNVRCPDVSFVAKSRVDLGRLPGGFPELVPDLVVEVLSDSLDGEDVVLGFACPLSEVVKTA
jgi:Uma2 family endonuclease